MLQARKKIFGPNLISHLFFTVIFQPHWQTIGDFPECHTDRLYAYGSAFPGLLPKLRIWNHPQLSHCHIKVCYTYLHGPKTIRSGDFLPLGTCLRPKTILFNVLGRPGSAKKIYCKLHCPDKDNPSSSLFFYCRTFILIAPTPPRLDKYVIRNTFFTSAKAQFYQTALHRWIIHRTKTNLP